MSDLDILRELVGQLPPPKYDELVAVARKRRRHSALAVAAAAAAVVVVVGITGAALSGGERSIGPAHDPSTSEEWTPERIRAEGSPADEPAFSESGFTVRQYVVCDGPRCDAADGPPEDMHVALEVTKGGQSAVFELHWGDYPWVSAFDEDSVLVQDTEFGPPEAPRYRLLRTDGTAAQLRLLDDPAPAVPGPDVVVIPRSTIIAGADEVYLVDDRDGTLRPLDVPEKVRYWGPNVDEFLWGVTDDCRVFSATAGTFEEHRLDCAKRLTFTSLANDSFPAGWLRPGRMVMEELSGPEDQTFVHVTLDNGSTWQRIPVEHGHIADVLRQLG